jgi:hypothetical protein
MRKQYGSFIGLRFGPENIVVLNSYKHVKEFVVYPFDC